MQRVSVNGSPGQKRRSKVSQIPTAIPQKAILMNGVLLCSSRYAVYARGCVLTIGDRSRPRNVYVE